MVDLPFKENIPFNIKLSENHIKGQVSGTGLKNNSVFDVKLKNGEVFQITASQDKELQRYFWISHAKGRSKRLAPIVGKIVERYFERKIRSK